MSRIRQNRIYSCPGVIMSLLAATLMAGQALEAQASRPNPEMAIRVMSYNVENLFDAEHDEGKSDWDFLPKNFPGKTEGCQAKSSRYRQACLESDWTEAKMVNKMQQIQKMVSSQGTMPDILALQEVENDKVMQRLSRLLGYEKYIIEEGHDQRGIDVALMYRTDRLTYLSHKSHRISHPAFSHSPTRDILAVYFQVRGSANSEILAAYVNHWPSQASTSERRVACAEELKKLIQEDRKRYGSALHTLAMGDFNTIDSDWPHPLRGVLLDQKTWSDPMIEVREYAEQKRALVGNLPLGTYFFVPKMAWNHLDRFFASKNLVDNRGLDVNLKSFKIATWEHAQKSFEYKRRDLPFYGSKIVGVPSKFNSWSNDGSAEGVSDHFPIEVTLELKR